MTLWENVWSQVAKELPARASRPKTWGGFFGAALAACLIVAIWFPIRLVFEILKAVNLSPKPDHRREAQDLFRQAYDLSRDLPSRNDFAASVLTHTPATPPA